MCVRVCADPCDDAAIDVTFVLNTQILPNGNRSVQLRGFGKTLSGAGEIVIFGSDPIVGFPCNSTWHENMFCANFTGKGGILTAPIRKHLDANTKYTVQFALINPRHSQEDASYIEMRFPHVCGLETFAPVVESAGPVLSPLAGHFVIKNIGQSTPWPGKLLRCFLNMIYDVILCTLHTDLAYLNLRGFEHHHCYHNFQRDAWSASATPHVALSS